MGGRLSVKVVRPSSIYGSGWQSLVRDVLEVAAWPVGAPLAQLVLTSWIRVLARPYEAWQRRGGLTSVRRNVTLAPRSAGRLLARSAPRPQGIQDDDGADRHEATVPRLVCACCRHSTPRGVGLES
jgi:hypothetical protein